MPDPINLEIANGNDDIYTLDGVSYNNTTIYLTGTNHRMGGFRFQNVTVPKGATITVCTLEVRVFSFYSYFRCDIYFEDEDSASVLVGGTLLNDRNLTSTSTYWNNTAGCTSCWKTSPSFATQLQEVISRPGWIDGNNVVVITDEDGYSENRGQGHSYESGDGSSAAKLHIEYVEDTFGPKIQTI